MSYPVIKFYPIPGPRGPTGNSGRSYGPTGSLGRGSTGPTGQVGPTGPSFSQNYLTANRAVITDNANQFASSIVSAIELSYLYGTTSPVQLQLNDKLLKSGDIMTGNLQLPAGTITQPSLNFTSSTKTGLSVIANNLSISTNAVEKMKISSSGVVSINGLTTAGVVHNNAFGNLTTSLIVNSDISNTASITDTKLATLLSPGKVANSATTATALNNLNTIVARNASGNFSAGTITASLIGNVNGNASLNVLKSGDTMTGILVLPSGLGTPALQFSGSTNTGISTSSPNTLSLYTNGQDRININEFGNVSINNLNVTGVVDPFSTGVVHTNTSGTLSTSSIINTDIENATITNSKLATISSSNTSGSIIVRDNAGHFATNQISIIGPVSDANNVATKQYVDDAIATGLVAKTPAIVVSKTDITLFGLQTIDIVPLTIGDRVLLTGQTLPVQNGLWLTQSDSWIRPTDFASGTVAGQAYVLITSGFINAGSSWLCNTPNAMIDTDPVYFSLFAMPGTTTGANVGTGVGQLFRDKTGNILNFKSITEGSHITVINNADDVMISTDATPTNISNTIVLRDVLGNFTASNITGNLMGSASNNVLKTGDSMSGSLNLLTQNEVRFQDASGGQYIGINSPSVVPINYTLSLPPVVPFVNQSLRSGSITANQLQWVTEGGSISPALNRVIYVTASGNDMTGNGSFDSPYASLLMAVGLANSISNVSNTVTILISAGTYIEDNSGGPINITNEGISIVGDSPSAVILIPSTPTHDFLVINQTTYISNATFMSQAPSARGIVLTLGQFSILTNLKVVNFLIGVECSGPSSSYLCELCTFINNTTGLYINDTAVECTGSTFIGASNIYSAAANTGLIINGSVAVCTMTSTSCLACTTGLNISNNALFTASAVIFKLNTYDIIQTEASHMTLLSCTFAITTNTNNIDIQISGTGTYAEIIGCHFNGKDISSIAGSTAIHVFDGALLDINGSDIKNYTTALHLGTPLNTSSTQLFISSIGIHACITDILQEGTTTLNLNASISTTSKIIINDSANVNLSYFDLNNNNALTIGANTDTNLSLIKAYVSTDLGIDYLSSLYSSQAIGYRNFSTNPSTLYSLSDSDNNITSITTDQSKNACLKLYSDTGSIVGGTSALRGWHINKNASTAELSFDYQNSDIAGQLVIPKYTVVQFDGVNNQLQLPTSRLVFGGDTNLYRSTANVLKTDDNFIVDTLTGSSVVITDANKQLASSVTTDTELSYLSGVISDIQPQVNSKVSKSGDIMTGSLQLPAGSITNPSLIFTGSINTGISASASSLSFSNNGIESLKIQSTGIVSINSLTNTGVIHNDINGNLSTSLIVDADIASAAAIQDIKLATISTTGKVANSSTSATSLNTLNTIVLRDISGNFSADTITANLIGNATTSTNFTGSLSGDITGTQTATIVNLVGGQSASNVATATILANNSTNLNTASNIVRRDASGNFSAGIITASLSGNATTSTSTSNFTGSLSGDVTGTQSITVVNLVGGQTAANVAAATVLANAATSSNTNNAIVRRNATGDISIHDLTSVGNIIMDTTISATEGVITKGGVRFIHNFGTNNTFTGISSGNFTLSGNQNVGYGTNTLATLSAGTNNTAIGYNCLTLATSSNNTAIGSTALDSLTNGSGCTAIGTNALTAASTASNATAVGFNCLAANIAASNTGVGANCMILNTSGANNTAFGFSTLATNLTGTNCTAMGTSALTLSTGSDNTAFGRKALTGVTTGIQNTAVGSSAGAAITIANNVVAIGAISLLSYTGTSEVTAIGGLSLTACTTGNNLAVGYAALTTVTTGTQSTGVGYTSLQFSTGSSCTALGYAAGQSITTGSTNICIGVSAGAGLTIGSNNIYIGTVATTSSDANVCKIGQIRNQTVTASVQNVFIDSDGRLGSISSTRETKDNIVDVDMNINASIIQKLRPRNFNYKCDPYKSVFYGMIVDEVIDIMPELISYNNEGNPDGLLYHHLPIMLLVEVQRLHQENIILHKKMDILLNVK